MAKDYGFNSLTLSRETGSTNVWARWTPKDSSKSTKVKGSSTKYVKKFKHYEYYWYYQVTTNGTWFPSSTDSTKITNHSTSMVSYSPPNNAIAVMFKMRAVMEKKEWPNDKKKQKVKKCPSFDWWPVTQVITDSTANTPAIPSASHTVDKNNVVTFTVNLSTEEVNKGVDEIHFNVAQVARTGGVDTYKTIHVNMTIPVIANKAIWHITLPGGYSYVYQAMARISSTGKQSAWSDWSSQTERIQTSPAKPTWDEDPKLNTASSIRIKFSVTGYAEEYEIEYAEKEIYLSDGTGMSQSTTVKEEKPEDPKHTRVVYLNNLETGNTYFIRVRARSSKFDPSEWSDIKTINIGREPGPPSTYSSKTAAKIGDTIRLYWVHNTQDGSSQTSAELAFYMNNDKELLGGSTIIYPNPNYENEYERDKTLFYPLELTADSHYDITDQSKTYDFKDGDLLEWKVRTKGVYNGGDNGGYGDYSALRQVTMFSPPVGYLFFKSGWLWNPLNLKDHTIPIDQLPTVTMIDRYPFIVVMSATPDTQQVISFNLQISNAGPAYETENIYGETVTVGRDEVLYQNYFDVEDLDKDVKNRKTLALYPNDIHFVNSKTYRFTLDVYTNSGLSAEPVVADVQAQLVTASPFEPEAYIEADQENMVAYISPACYDSTGESEYDPTVEEYDEPIERTLTENVLMDVYRINTDGTFTLIEENIPNDERTIFDPHPSLDYARYRIVATKYSTGEINFMDYTAEKMGIHSLVIQWEENFESVSDSSEIFNTDSDLDTLDASRALVGYSGNRIVLPWNIDTTESFSPDVAFIEYIGREHPVSYYGTQLGQTASWSTLIAKYDPDSEEYQDFDTNLLFKLRKLARYMGNCYVREPSGTGYWANVTVNWSQTHNDPGIPVSLEIKRVEGGK